MWNWDYQIDDNWKPSTDGEWEWFLTRKLNYGDYTGIPKAKLHTYFPKIKDRLDPGVRDMLEYYLTHDIHR